MFDLGHYRGALQSREISGNRRPAGADLDWILEFKPEGHVSAAAGSYIMALLHTAPASRHADAWHCRHHCLMEDIKGRLPPPSCKFGQAKPLKIGHSYRSASMGSRPAAF